MLVIHMQFILWPHGSLSTADSSNAITVNTLHVGYFCRLLHPDPAAFQELTAIFI